MYKTWLIFVLNRNFPLKIIKLNSFICLHFSSSFQFETEAEGGRLRRDVLAAGGVSTGGTPSGIISIISGQEEMFAFRRAVSHFFNKFIYIVLNNEVI